MAKYLHTMIRVSSLEDSIAFFEALGLHEIRCRPDEKGRYMVLVQIVLQCESANSQSFGFVGLYRSTLR
jgi:catechol 2,3-dioxygenase-like lactoylglutathione lyase family enzyme